MKKLLSLVISICIITGFSTSIYAVDYGEELKNAPTKTYEQKFSDVPENYWAFGYISEMAERGVLNGYPDGKFYPNSQVTRAEFAKIMTVAAGLNIAEPTMQIFSDVKITDWYAPYVHTAKEYLSAYNQNGSSYYLPNTPALREDIAVALVKLKGYSTTGADMTTVTRMFSDYQSISGDARIYVAAAIENGLISGYDDGTFRGQNSITRAEAATLLWRAYQYGNANKTYGNDQNVNNAVNNKENVTIQEENSYVEPVEEKKPYSMKTLVEVDLEIPGTSSVDNENLYYIDEDGCIYKTNIYTGSNVKYFDSDTIKSTDIALDEGNYKRDSEGLECTLDSYVPYQVFCDTKYDRVLLSGYYEIMYQGIDSQEGKYCVVHDITDGKSELIGFLDSTGSEETIYDVLSEYVFLMGPYYGGSVYSYNFKNQIYDYNSKKATYTSYYGVVRNGNFLYSLDYDMGDVIVEKCDLSSNNFEEITKGRINWYAVTNDSYYFIENRSENSISKFNTKDEKISRLFIDFSNDVSSKEIISINDFNERFFVMDDNTMIFYDEYMKAFRILEKN